MPLSCGIGAHALQEEEGVIIARNSRSKQRLNISTDQLRKIECGSRGPAPDLLILLAVYFDVSTDYLLIGRDYVNLHSRKRLESVLQELSGIIADLQDV